MESKIQKNNASHLDCHLHFNGRVRIVALNFEVLKFEVVNTGHLRLKKVSGFKFTIENSLPLS